MLGYLELWFQMRGLPLFPDPTHVITQNLYENNIFGAGTNASMHLKN